MKQYNSIKAKHPDAILLFRVGDFYETFSDDAIKAARILGITLTKRANGSAAYVELAGFPYHALDTYLPKLVRAGQRVAICEQLENPKEVKGIVKRGVTELVTPGVTLNDNILENKENNYLACVNLQKQNTGVAFLDISTGEFYTAQGSTSYIDKLLNSLQPKEILYERSKQQALMETFGNKFYIYPLEDWVFSPETAIERLLKQFDTVSLKGFGVENLTNGNIAAGAILQYLDITRHEQLKHVSRLSRIEEDKYVWLDKFTIRNLELFYASSGDASASLLHVIDHTQSAMGSRMLKRWLALPLKNPDEINQRLDAVEFFYTHTDTSTDIATHIKQIGDLERLVSKIASQRINPREIIMLKNSLLKIPAIRSSIKNAKLTAIQQIYNQLVELNELTDKIAQTLCEDAPALLSKGHVVRKGFSEELDELRELSTSGKDHLEKMQQYQSKMTGIPSLKIGFNNVFGYYFEVRNTYKLRVPQDWVRKQTLVSAERYVNQELKEYESKILGAQDKIAVIESQIYNRLVSDLQSYIDQIQQNAQHVAQLDCLTGFATTAHANAYTKPEINDTTTLKITEGRHPVIEKQLPVDEPYISNNVTLDQKKQQIIIVTGPNMAGKSALLRQTALIVLMAQIGSFVPAQKAEIGYVDKIFTRVGASDNIASGESTFMVEMNEAASILNNISDRSLILFDELGRGTSTYDGISIAWAIVEHIHEHPQAKAKTLFATHYHELNEMENTFSRIKNYNVSVREVNNKVHFLRKLVPGGSEHSFGIHVARMAGMPPSVVQRADKILLELEKTREKHDISKPMKQISKSREGMQLSFFQLDDPVLEQIRAEIINLDINALTPIEALNKLNEIKKITNS